MDAVVARLDSTVGFFFGEDLYTHVQKLAVFIAVLGGLHVVGLQWGVFDFFLWTALIVLATLAIWRAGDFFSEAAEYIEEKHAIPQSIKAAVIDAIASSFPEFCVAVIAVIMIGKAEVGIATVIGSALYNVLVIPAAAGLVAASPMVISKEVVWRDNLVYMGIVLLLMAMIYAFPTEWGFGVATIFLLSYVAYAYWLISQFKAHKAGMTDNATVEEESDEEEEESDEEDAALKITAEKHAWYWLGGMMVMMGFASHIMVEASLQMGNLLGIEAVIMAFVVIAAGTSVPDMVLSIISAKKGNYDAAISNVFGSNIFDITVCLSVPILLALLLSGATTPVDLPQTELVWILFASTIVSFYMFWSDNYTLTKPKAAIMGGLYLFVVLYAFTL